MSASLKVGDRIELEAMPEDPNPIPTGARGTVNQIEHFNGFTQIWVTWDEHRTLALCCPPDRYVRLDPRQEAREALAEINNALQPVGDLLETTVRLGHGSTVAPDLQADAEAGFAKSVALIRKLQKAFAK